MHVLIDFRLEWNVKQKKKILGTLFHSFHFHVFLIIFKVLKKLLNYKLSNLMIDNYDHLWLDMTEQRLWSISYAELTQHDHANWMFNNHL